MVGACVHVADEAIDSDRRRRTEEAAAVMKGPSAPPLRVRREMGVRARASLARPFNWLPVKPVPSGFGLG